MSKTDTGVQLDGSGARLSAGSSTAPRATCLLAASLLLLAQRISAKGVACLKSALWKWPCIVWQIKAFFALALGAKHA